MPSYTLLDYVQTIASSMDSEEVNSYDDSVESLQIAKIVKTVYNSIQARADLPEHFTLFELTASGDTSKPVLMTKPSSVMSLEWIEYDKHLDGNTDPLYQRIEFLPLDEFLRMQDNLKVSATEVASFTQTLGDDADSITFLYRNNRAPTYWTSFDDNTIIFDSFDSTVDNTLQKTKTRAYGRKDQTFTMSNTFVPFLDADMSTLLLNEAKILAFSEMKQVGHDVAKQWANRGWTKVQQNKRSLDHSRLELDRAPNYGRK